MPPAAPGRRSRSPGSAAPSPRRAAPRDVPDAARDAPPPGTGRSCCMTMTISQDTVTGRRQEDCGPASSVTSCIREDQRLLIVRPYDLFVTETVARELLQARTYDRTRSQHADCGRGDPATPFYRRDSGTAVLGGLISVSTRLRRGCDRRVVRSQPLRCDKLQSCRWHRLDIAVPSFAGPVIRHQRRARARSVPELLARCRGWSTQAAELVRWTFRHGAVGSRWRYTAV